ncbi:fimbrial protein [Stenotrophomonas maltophilia]|uniref:CS1 type fimbrial major subunit n=1 Tax=Stenotrophomonas TaxID=40323 RepID=UPI000DAA883F|nr:MULTISPECIES: CS1 type fimbrial major subunit [Stenotrophomonas]MCV0220539.1 fimbrial protein [Stenotrophomonas sp. Ps181]PZS83837.1 fimbrial protein [Stenotrophomonas maltophilia]PZT11041.1 fimbrial protein [Stenotrophomonas maltophilia]
MNTFLKKAALAAALATASLSAHAAEAEIAVWADVDPTLALLKENGTALDDSVKLVFNPVLGRLADWTDRVRIYSNSPSKDIEVRLGADPVLLRQGGGGTPVPLAVSLNGAPLSTAPHTFEASKIFDGALNGASIPMELRIGHGGTDKIDVEGKYEGIVTIAMVQAAGTP